MERLRLGIFGGTFDPPHDGHLRLARAARAQLQLDQVLWLIAADPPHKQGQPITPAADRLALVQAALVGEPAFSISLVDLNRPGPHYSVDAVRLIAAQYPFADLVFLLGGDSLRDLPTWRNPQALLERCTLAVLGRPGVALDWTALEAQLPGLRAKVTVVDAPQLDIAARDLRARRQAGQPLTDLVPEAVAQVIVARNLYR